LLCQSTAWVNAVLFADFSAELVGHLCGPGPHWRGCFALDAILGKG
jgi:hypothetical protein